jgi:hypothetical protein
MATVKVFANCIYAILVYQLVEHNESHLL